MTTELAAFARAYQTDKCDQGCVPHHYDLIYDGLFRPLRDQPIRLLEIGILRGESLRLWRDYFKKGKVFGLDIEPKEIEGTICFQGDQADAELLERIGRLQGPFDIIIDDGSHVGKNTTASFRVLSKHLTINGMYIVEDLASETGEPYQDDEPFTRTGLSEVLHLVHGINNRWSRIIASKELLVFCK